jgi:hypothetical protein
MGFLKRNKNLIVNCYTNKSEVYNYCPIILANKAIPDWFKALPTPQYKGPSSKENVRNLKECVAFLKYFSKGFVLPLWSDLFLEIGPKGTTQYRYQYSDCSSEIDIHDENSSNKAILDSEYQHLKLISPWVIRCDEEVDFIALQPEWHFDKLNFSHVLSGVMDFKVNAATNVNMYVKRQKEQQNFLLKVNTPIYHFVPITERKMVLKNHLVSNEEFRNIQQANVAMSFKRHYYFKRNALKQNKCPFKFDV